MAEAGGPWGCVNLRLLILFHPDMATFDFARGLFFRQDPLAGDRPPAQRTASVGHDHDHSPPGSPAVNAPTADVLDRLNQGWERVAPRLRTLQERRDQLNAAQMRDLIQRETDLQEVPLPANPREISPAEMDRRVKRRAEIEAVFSARAKTYEEQLAVVERDLEAVIREAEGAVYLTEEESEARFQRILQDVRAQIQAVAAHHQVAVVIDASAGKRSHLLNADLPLLQSYNDLGDAVVGDLFHFLINWRPTTGGGAVTLASGRPLSLEAFHAALFGLPLGRRAARSLVQSPHLTGPLLGFTTTNACLSGFQDLTPQVAHSLLARYAMPPEMRNSLVLFLRDFVEFQRDGRPQFVLPPQGAGK
ncbi:MAG: hypothetical protein OZSIB_3424 [Candidatus Ozemobacter sibiricus]|uniref:Uncharacterized protein n=1 Tax=Candidatus Ozemobacter sibiricus TaxID=2268124 RepID=A0A367ZS88_9BACT|nr:MAG: hypothetical protein OZSIB_3424 [Candidatus Ozemobacter sibiricus]